MATVYLAEDLKSFDQPQLTALFGDDEELAWLSGEVSQDRLRYARYVAKQSVSILSMEWTRN